MDSLRLSGLASGLDTDSVITQLMSIERRPVTQMQQAKVATQKRLDHMRTLNTKLAALRTAAKALVAPTDGDPFRARTATPSDAAAFSVKSTGGGPVGTYAVDVLARAKAQKLGGGTFDAAHGAGTLSIAGAAGTADIAVAAGDTADQVAAKINAAEACGLNAAVLGGKLVLVGKATGAAAGCTVTAAGGLALEGLGLAASATDVAAADARIRVADVEVTSPTNTFEDLMPGIDLTVLKEGTGFTLGIDANPDAAVTAIKDLVQKANDVIAYAQAETKHDASAKTAGTLAGESLVRDLPRKLNQLVGDVFDKTPGGNGGYGSASRIGISTTRDGSLALDEAKLRAALAADPEAVRKLLTHEDGAVAAANPRIKLNQATDGLATRLAAFADQLVDVASDYNGFASGVRARGGLLSRLDNAETMLKGFDDRIEAYEGRLTLREQSLRTQFAAMEQTVAKLHSQGNYFASQLSQSAA